MQKDKHYRLYLGIDYKSYLSRNARDAGKDPNSLDAYLTDCENTILPDGKKAFFTPTNPPKRLKHQLKPKTRVQIMHFLKEPLKENDFVIGKVYRIPELVCSMMRYATLLSQNNYNSTHCKICSTYGEKIRSAEQQKNYEQTQLIHQELNALLKMLHEPTSFEEFVKQLATRLILKERKK